MTTPQSQALSLYRRILRELPSRRPQHYSLLASPSPVQIRIRQTFSSPLHPSASSSASSSPAISDSSVSPAEVDPSVVTARLQEAEQYVQYLKAQRMYATLIERYNPGMNMNEEERVRLTARRVGMDLPPELMGGGGGEGR